MTQTTKLWLASSLLVLAAGPLQADNQKGSWSQLVDWPIIPIHAVMTPQGKILSFGTDELGNQGAQFSYDVWDPESGTGADSHNTLPNTLGVDSFCSAAIVMPETGDILMAGGDDRVNVNRGINDAPIFRVGTETLDRAPEMASARWYPTSTILANGDVLLSGGYDEFARAVPTPEIYSPSTNSWRSLLGASTAEYGYYYPRQWVAPNGKVFGYFESKKMFSMDTSGNGNLEFKGVMDVIGSPYDSTAVMYRPGKILHVSGSGVDANNQDYTNSAYQLDITNEDPILTKITDPNEKGRIWVNSVVLPNGKVFIRPS